MRGSLHTLLALTLTGCAAGRADAPPDPASADPAVVRRGVLQPHLLLTGEVKAVREERINVPRTPSSQVTIRWMEVDGTSVTEGQKVFELDHTQFTNELDQKRLAEARAANDLDRKRADLALEQAEKAFDVERTRVALEKAKLDADVPEELRSRRDYQEKQLEVARKEAAARKAEEDANATQRAADAALRELQVGLERAQEDVRIAENALAQLTLYAPRAGMLVIADNWRDGRKYQVGDAAWVGLALGGIPDLSAMQVVARLSDVDDGKIAPGMAVTCTLDAYPDRSYAGHVTEIAPVASTIEQNSSRRSFRVTIQLDAADPERMLPGMSVLAEVQLAPLPNVLLAPRGALELGSDKPRARLADGSSAEVRLGPCDAQHCVIEQGLSEGTRLGAGA
ncbi:MAG TPA: efflux RND transporter periplasmic adaptor subunit [Candidatus Polarisedimenticolaceae bacterium]|nr:efflux RND transporter periplasmic adaptor subunit [Candidatus Polarisedimenticolaceae bacterium]